MLDPFYLIVDDSRWLDRLLPEGVKFVQLRVKDRPEAETRAEIARARSLCEEAGAQLVVNDYWRLAIEEGCDYVHLGQEDLADADVAAIREAGVKLGVSTHDHEELQRALAVDPDYVALGPIYATVLKEMTWQPQGLPRLGEWKDAIGDIPLVAIGGFTPERAKEALIAGADIVAVVTDVLRNSDPEGRTREWVMATRRPI